MEVVISSSETGSAQTSEESTTKAEPEANALLGAMARIPAGIFTMGSNGLAGDGEEQPAHEVAMPAFEMDYTEVTVEAYAACEAANACTRRHLGRRFCDEAVADRLRMPANCIDLWQAKAFCEWAGKRLPTEREWEYAASGGAEQRKFSWGNDDPTPRNSCYQHAGGSCEVRSFEAGAFGLYDVSGNVWEWTQSEFRKYPSSPDADPIVAHRHYVYRGGSWSRRFPKWLRSGLRNRYRPDEWSASLGVRCARTIEPLECPPRASPLDGRCVLDGSPPECPRHQQRNDRGHCAAVIIEGVEPRPFDGAPASQPMNASPPRLPGLSTSAAHRELPAPSTSADVGAAERPITRARTPSFDDDCRRHWPATPFAYRFDGGLNFPARAPIVKAAGCVTRDMGRTWTSACCPA